MNEFPSVPPYFIAHLIAVLPLPAFPGINKYRIAATLTLSLSLSLSRSVAHSFSCVRAHVCLLIVDAVIN